MDNGTGALVHIVHWAAAVVMHAWAVVGHPASRLRVDVEWLRLVWIVHVLVRIVSGRCIVCALMRWVAAAIHAV